MATKTVQTCYAPVGPRHFAEVELCGLPACNLRTVAGVETMLCDVHAAEVDLDRTKDEIGEHVKAIKHRLIDLGWDCDGDTLERFVVSLEEDLPFGWVRLYDDNVSYYSHAEAVRMLLMVVGPDPEYGANLEEMPTEPPQTSNDWPSHLVEWKQLEEGTPNENPLTLVAIHTNGGTLYTAGPHGANHDAMADAFIHWSWELTYKAAVDKAVDYSVDEDEEDGSIGNVFEMI